MDITLRIESDFIKHANTIGDLRYTIKELMSAIYDKDDLTIIRDISISYDRGFEIRTDGYTSIGNPEYTIKIELEDEEEC